MIQDGPQNTGADKPLRITGDPYKVQVNFTLSFIKGLDVFGKSCMGNYRSFEACFLNWLFLLQQAKEMVLELIRDQGGFREVRNEYGSRIGGNEGIDVSKNPNQMTMCESVKCDHVTPFWKERALTFFSFCFGKLCVMFFCLNKEHCRYL